jgi:uncharacterized repeat protein (TIGR01451 family)
MSIFSKVKDKVKSTKLKARVLAASFVLVIASIAALATMGGAAAAPSTTPDCDANAAVWCGVSQAGSLANEIAQVKKVYANGDGHNKYYTIQDMYNYFGMSTSVINGMSTSNVVSGYVTKTGDVYAGNTLVATGAVTAGRQNMTGSTAVKYGATTFYTRTPSVSFQDSELGALVNMKNGVFQSAILVSCGNPVKATPKKPNYSITKQVATAANGSFGSSVSVQSGAAVFYKIAVKSTGAIPVNNVTVHDTLPSGIAYTGGTLQENGKAVSSTNASSFFGTGLNVGTINNGVTDTFTFAAKAGTVAFSDPSCKPGTGLTNNGYVAAPGLSTLNANAKVSTTCAPAAALACTSLTAVAGTADAAGNQQYTFTAKANPQNVTITDYNFDFGDKATAAVKSSAASVTTTHTYAPGSYTAKFTVTGTAAATSKTYTSSACTFSVNVKQAPKPNYTILKQVATSANGSFDSNVSVQSGATVFYKITVSSTGDAPVTNVNVKDALPTDVKYTTGTLKQDGTAVSASDASNFFGNGLVVASIKNGSSTVFTYSAVAGNTATNTDPSCKAETLDNTGTISTTGLSNQQSRAEVQTTCAQLPGTLACVGLTAIGGAIDASTGNQSYTFNGTASVNNSKIGTYTFTITNTDTNKVVATIPVNSTATSVTTAAQSLAPGNYSATVAVAGTDNYGNALQAPANANCAKAFTVNQPECKPGIQAGSSSCFTYTCNLFTVQVTDLTNRVVKVTGFTASSTNPSAATPTQVMVEWGDGTHDQTAYADASTLTHTFAAAQKYTITAIGEFTTPDSTTPVNSTACTAPVDFTVPPVMPDTGAGDVIGIFIGTVATATIAARLFLSRKLARR